MTVIASAIAWITANYLIVFGIIGGLIVVAKLATKLTKTEKDDEVVEKIEDGFDRVKSIVGAKAQSETKAPVVKPVDPRDPFQQR